MPTVVLGGWLGAGKTTLLNRWLREANGQRLAVLVNDFGDISIDADLIEGADDDVISLAGGCICCAVGSDLFGALRRMTARVPRPDLLLVETSGVALPAAAARTVGLVPGIAVRAVVVLVDSLAWPEQCLDRYVADTVRQQVAEADLLVLTKLHPDMADDALRQALAAIAPQTPVLDVQADAAVLRQAVLDNEVPRQAMVSPAAVGPTLRPLASAVAPAASRFASTLESFEHAVDPQELVARWTAEAGAVVRAKGWVTGLDGRRWRIQLVGSRASVELDDRAPPQDRVVVIRRRPDV